MGLDIRSSVFWLTLTSTVLLACLLATQPYYIFLPTSRSSYSTVPKGLSLPDTTAIVLNWSRLPNVIRIVSLLCGTWLDDTIAEVIVWNNNPKKLDQQVGISFSLVRHLAHQAV